MRRSKPLTLINLAPPIFLEMLLRSLAGIINISMVAHINEKLVGALGAGNQVFVLFITIFSFLSIGCSVVVAQALGAGDKNLAARAIHTSLAFNAILGAVCGVLIYFNAQNMLKLLQVPTELINSSEIYLKALCWALIIEAASIVLAAVIRVKNYATAITIISAGINILIIIGNAIALFGIADSELGGLYGVGISNIIARFIGLLALIFVLIKITKTHIFIGLFFTFKMAILSKILKVGLPSAGENLLWFGQYMVAFGFVASMGASSLSVQTIYFQLSVFVFLSASAISIANEIIVGHLVGSKQMERAYKHGFYALKIGFFITIIVVGLFFASQNIIMGALDLSGELMDIMRPLFTLSLLLESGRTLNVIMVNSLRASGDARFPFYMGIIFMWGVSLPLGYILGLNLGLGIIGVWLGFVADEWGRGIANTLRWRSRKWQNKRLV